MLVLGRQVAKGENVRIYLQFDSEDEIRKVYDVLKIDGKVDFELQQAFFGALLAVLTDKNGINWNLSWCLKTIGLPALYIIIVYCLFASLTSIR